MEKTSYLLSQKTYLISLLYCLKFFFTLALIIFDIIKYLIENTQVNLFILDMYICSASLT
jgi:hypothetical protein